MTTLDGQIRDIFDVLSLTLVFVITLLGALYHRGEELIEVPRPDSKFDQDRLRKKLSRTSDGFGLGLLFVLAVLILMTPVTLGVLRDISPAHDYSVLRAGYLLINTLLASGGVTAWKARRRLKQRIQQI